LFVDLCDRTPSPVSFTLHIVVLGVDDISERGIDIHARVFGSGYVAFRHSKPLTVERTSRLTVCASAHGRTVMEVDKRRTGVRVPSVVDVLHAYAVAMTHATSGNLAA
jgi:hypothetical protein